MLKQAKVFRENQAVEVRALPGVHCALHRELPAHGAVASAATPGPARPHPTCATPPRALPRTPTTLPQTRIMDSNDLERERGITILSKVCIWEAD